MISVALARELRNAGLTWIPAHGDRFVVADRGMDDEVFVLADLTIEVREYPSGPVIGFNGTTEWALDSLEKQDAIWLPAENQLREMLGVAFARLDRIGERHRVAFVLNGTQETIDAADPSDAYAAALLRVIHRFRAAGDASHSAE